MDYHANIWWEDGTWDLDPETNLSAMTGDQLLGLVRLGLLDDHMFERLTAVPHEVRR